MCNVKIPPLAYGFLGNYRDKCVIYLVSNTEIDKLGEKECNGADVIVCYGPCKDKTDNDVVEESESLVCLRSNVVAWHNWLLCKG